MQLLTERQLADKLSVTRVFLHVHRQKGLPYLKLGRSIRYDEKKVIEWFQNQMGKRGA